MAIDTSVAGSKITQEEKVAKKVAKGFNVKAGSLGGILTTQNPAEQRRLRKRLERLENERRRRVGHMTWNQRNFFMKQVFDQDNDFRFVKAEQRPAYMAGIPAMEEENDGNETMRESYPVLTDKRNSPMEKRGCVSGFNGERHRQTKARLPKIRVKSLGIFASGTQFRHNAVGGGRPMTRRTVPLTKSRPLTRTQSTMSLTQSRLVKENTDTSLNEREQGTDAAAMTTTGKFGSAMGVVHESVETDAKKTEQKEKEFGEEETGFNEHQIKDTPQLPAAVNANMKELYKPMRREQTTIGVGKKKTKVLPMLVAPARNTASAPHSPRKIVRERTDLSSKIPLTGNDREGTYLPEISQKYRFEPDEIDEAELEAATEEAKEKEREKLLRRLTRTLPTHLMVKTYQRESEAGAESSIRSKKKRLLEKSRKEVAKNVLSDPRFTNMVRSLTICK
ncbi:uncharacterized protein LOC144350040 [Saccoglossus kowalevskii]